MSWIKPVVDNQIGQLGSPQPCKFCKSYDHCAHDAPYGSRFTEAKGKHLDLKCECEGGMSVNICEYAAWFIWGLVPAEWGSE